MIDFIGFDGLALRIMQQFVICLWKAKAKEIIGKIMKLLKIKLKKATKVKLTFKQPLLYHKCSREFLKEKEIL